MQEKLARFEYNQAEKFREMGDLKQAVMKYAAAHEIIPNFEDTPVRIINLEFEMGNTKKATILLDEQIKAQVRLKAYYLSDRMVKYFDGFSVGLSNLNTVRPL